jgi:hypothetical protein
MKDWGFGAGCLASKRRRVKGVQSVFERRGVPVRAEKYVKSELRV